MLQTPKMHELRKLRFLVVVRYRAEWDARQLIFFSIITTTHSFWALWDDTSCQHACFWLSGDKWCKRIYRIFEFPVSTLVYFFYLFLYILSWNAGVAEKKKTKCDSCSTALIKKEDGSYFQFCYACGKDCRSERGAHKAFKHSWP